MSDFRAILLIAIAIWPLSASAASLNFAPITGALSITSIFVVAGYFMVQLFGRRARLLLIELVFIVEDGNDIASSIERLKDESHRGASGRRAALSKWVATLHASTILDGELHVKEEGFGNAALAVDAADLVRQQSAIVTLREPAGHRRCIVGLIFTLDLVGELRSGGYDEAIAHLNFLYDHRPIDTDSLHAYYGALAEGDDGEEFLEELSRTRQRVHSPDIDLI